MDDGSTDSSGKLCDDISLLDKRVVVYHKINGGACPKSTPSVSSTHCQNNLEGRLHFEKRTFRTA